MDDERWDLGGCSSGVGDDESDGDGEDSIDDGVATVVAAVIECDDDDVVRILP